MKKSSSRVINTWESIDIEKVRDVSWLAIKFFMSENTKKFSKEKLTETVWGMLLSRFAKDKRKLMGAALVCGDMKGESSYFENSPIIKFIQVDGFDISSTGIKSYNSKQFKFKRYMVDCNDLVLKPNYYHFIIGSHGVHHVMNLGGLFYQANTALKPKGIIFLNEWIGPNYLQIPLINHIFAGLLLLILFPNPKSRTTAADRVKGLWVQMRPAAFDPSEACNSTELWPQYTKYFRPIRTFFYGGLCYPVFEGLGERIDESLFINKIRIRIVYYTELFLTSLKIIKPLFVLSIGTKRELDARNKPNLQTRIYFLLNKRKVYFILKKLRII